MSISENKIISKLQMLDEYLSYLREMQKVNKKSFLADYHFFGLAEHYLHLSIQVILDVSKLLIIHAKLPRPEEPREVIDVLYKEKVISKVLMTKLSGITGFRNILVHEYEKINREIVYTYLHKNIGMFEAFKKAALKFLA